MEVKDRGKDDFRRKWKLIYFIILQSGSIFEEAGGIWKKNMKLMKDERSGIRY